MIRPTILYEDMQGNGVFFGTIPEGYTAKESDFTISSLPSENYVFRGRTRKKSWVAIRSSGVWKVEDVELSFGGGSLTIFCIAYNKPHDAYAYPIDPAMTRQDIEGATRIYENSDRTGWLFAHADTEHHHERVILLEAIMHTLFEDLVHDRLSSVLKAVVGHNNPSPPIGTALLYNYNAQSGSLANYQTLLEFRKECVKWCAEVEKLLFLGQHVQESDHFLKHQLVRAIKQAKAVWKADTEGKARNLVSIESQINGIIARVETEHEIETRWVKAARIEAAKKAAAAAESETPTGD